MKQGTKRLLSMAVALVLIVGAFVIFFDFIKPAYGELQKNASVYESTKLLLSEQTIAVSKVKEMISGAKNAKARDFVSLALPLGPDVGTGLVQLERLVKESGLALQSLSPSMSSPGASRGGIVKPSGIITYQVSAGGSYEGLKDLLKKIESNTLLFEVKSLSITPPGKLFGSYQFNLTVVSYYQQI